MALIPWRSLREWDPLEEWGGVQDRLNRLFEETFGRYPVGKRETLERTWSPVVDIYEEKDSIIVKAELPGIKKDEVSIEIKDNVLTLSGERKYEQETKKENYHRIERFYGKFSRSFTLPETVQVEKVKANYKDGVLEITLPKAEETKPKSIPIKIE
jgi:HSP20 family protein